MPELDFAEPHELNEIDPVSVLVTDLLTDGLTEINPETGTAVPALADAWTVSEDGLTWTFLLGDFEFGDGEPIEADDVVESLNRVARRGIDSLSGPNLWAIDGWLDVAPQAAAADDANPPEDAEDDADGTEGSDDTVGSDGDGQDEDADPGVVPGAVAGLRVVAVDEVEITLTTPFAGLPEILAGAVFGVLPANLDLQSDLPLSSARNFRPTAVWDDGIRVAGEEVPGEISAIELFEDPEGTLLGAGEVDLAVGLTGSAVSDDFQTSATEWSAHVFYAMNAAEPPFDDPLIRQAVLHAIDREAIRDEFFPSFGLMDNFVSSHPIDAEVVESRDSCSGACEYNPEQAALLASASPSRLVQFTVDYFDDGPAAGGTDVSREQLIAEEIVDSLRLVGLDATAVGHDPGTYGTLAGSGELDLFRFGSVSAVPSREADIGVMFGTNGQDNISSISIDRFDDLLDEARSENDPGDRLLIYNEAEQVVFGEAALIPLVTLQHRVFFGDTLSAAALEPDGSLNLSAMEFVVDQFEDE